MHSFSVLSLFGVSALTPDNPKNNALYYMILFLAVQTDRSLPACCEDFATLINNSPDYLEPIKDHYTSFNDNLQVLDSTMDTNTLQIEFATPGEKRT